MSTRLRLRKILMGATTLAVGITALMMLGSVQAFAVHVTCGDTITQDTTLDSDLLDCPGNGIVIGADGITLDLNGHVIDGVNGYQTGVNNLGGFNDLTVKDGTVREFGRGGVFVQGASGNLLTGLTVEHNPDFGIAVADSRDTRVENNIAFENRPPAHNFGTGIKVQSGSGDSVRWNTTFDNEEGIGVTFGEQDAVIEGNSLLRDYLDCGCIGSSVVDNSVVDGGMLIGIQHGRVDHNSISGSDSPGMLIRNSIASRISDNSVSGTNFYGIFMQDSIGLEVVGNSLSGNRVSGISIEAGSGGNVVERNRISDNGRTGIAIGEQLFNGSPGSNRIANNRVLGSGMTGIHVRAGIDTLVTGNSIRRSGADGILVEDFLCPVCGPSSAGTVLGGNSTVRNGDDGIDVNAVDATVERNRADHNADLGIVALPGVTDGGGNRARHNGNPLQCFNVVCKQ